ncbi:MAG: M50 family metallopeptidase [Candidatus Saccharimonadales bacterium]
MSTILLIAGLILFLGLVVVHEFGHFIMARRGGVGVEEFGLGFPPRLFKKRTKNGWLFTVNLLPLGGFVKLKGEHDTDTEKGSFGAASVAVKTKIMAAGVTMNLIAAFVLLTLLALVGMPQLVNNQFTIKSDSTYVQRAQNYISVGSVESGSPAAKTGLKTNDTIMALGPVSHLVEIKNINNLPTLTKRYAGQTVEVEYKQNNSGPIKYKIITLRSLAVVKAAQAAGKQIGYLGVSVDETQTGLNLIRSTWSAPIVSAGLIKQFTVLTFEGLGKALEGLGSTIAGAVSGNTQARQAGLNQASSEVVGPVGIFFVFKDGSVLGYRFVLMIVAILSLVLAIMNILPIPALDGGRLWLILITRAIKKPLSPHREEIINATGFVCLMLLVVLITFSDVKKFL